mmetsp:Transcript_43653/g.139049  ORF Transcript_43653/g.139049 Transcript_43653/m.139049 type:complete len:425 (-) Transcript_43653:1851-3125(-)
MCTRETVAHSAPKPAPRASEIAHDNVELARCRDRRCIIDLLAVSPAEADVLRIGLSGGVLARQLLLYLAGGRTVPHLQGGLQVEGPVDEDDHIDVLLRLSVLLSRGLVLLPLAVVGPPLCVAERGQDVRHPEPIVLQLGRDVALVDVPLDARSVDASTQRCPPLLPTVEAVAAGLLDEDVVRKLSGVEMRHLPPARNVHLVRMPGVRGLCGIARPSILLPLAGRSAVVQLPDVVRQLLRVIQRRALRARLEAPQADVLRLGAAAGVRLRQQLLDLPDGGAWLQPHAGLHAQAVVDVHDQLPVLILTRQGAPQEEEGPLVLQLPVVWDGAESVPYAVHDLDRGELRAHPLRDTFPQVKNGCVVHDGHRHPTVLLERMLHRDLTELWRLLWLRWWGRLRLRLRRWGRRWGRLRLWLRRRLWGLWLL